MTDREMAARDKFKGIAADFWDCEDPEVLKHLDPISALEAIVDHHRAIVDHRTMSVEEVIRTMGEISVEAYRRSKHSTTHIEDAIDAALERAREALEDESDLSEGDRPMFSLDVLAKHRPAFEAAVLALVTEAVVWQCEVARSVELSPDETIAILRAERPEWFETCPPEEPPSAATIREWEGEAPL
jgi:hypothetical protein